MKMDEIYDSKLELTYSTKGSTVYGSFKVDEHVYAIQFEELPGDSFSMDLKDKTVAEVSFHRADVKGDAAFATTNDSKATTAVYGVVLNAAIDKFKDYDGFLVVVEPRHSTSEKELSQKQSIYEYLIRRVQKRTGATLYHRKNGTADQYLLSKIELTDASEHHFVDLHEELNQLALAGLIAELKRVS